jgi:predicted Zn-dependent protease with MMP-like domain
LANGPVIEVEPGRFEDMVVTTLDALPEELGQLMRNVAVTVEHRPGPPGLLGLYEGIPLTSRTSQYAGVLPDRITIHRQAICATCRTEQEASDQAAPLSTRSPIISALTTTGSANSAGKTWI